jgi:hypothetical protein
MIRCGLERLRRATEWSRSRSESKALISLYYQVTELRSDPWHLSVTPSHLAEHLEFCDNCLPCRAPATIAGACGWKFISSVGGITLGTTAFFN